MAGKALRWLLFWFLLVVGIGFIGAMTGAILFPIAGSFLRMDLGWREMCLNGIKDGGFLAMIWAPGASIVICFIRAHAGAGDSPPKVPNGLDSLN